MHYTVWFTTYTAEPPIKNMKIFDVRGTASDSEVRGIAQRVAGYSAEITRIIDSTGRSIETPIERELRLDEERISDEMDWADVRGISAPDF